MKSSSSLAVALGLSVAISGLGCASQTPNAARVNTLETANASGAQRRDQAHAPHSRSTQADAVASFDPAQSEARQQVVRRGHQELELLGLELGRVAQRLHTEGTPAQRAHFSSGLSDLEHDRRIVQSLLEKAAQGPVEDWNEESERMAAMIGALVSIGMQTAEEVEDAIEAGLPGKPPAPEAQHLPADLDLCTLQVSGSRAGMREHRGRLIVEMSASHPAAVAALRRRALEVSARSLATFPAAGGSQRAASAQQVEFAIEDATHGVLVVFMPAADQLEPLRAQLATSVERIENQSC